MTRQATYQDGYQAALFDLACALHRDGAAGAAQWIVDNATDQAVIYDAHTALRDANRDRNRLAASAAYLDACDFDADDDARRWQIEVDAHNDADDAAATSFTCTYGTIRRVDGAR